MALKLALLVIGLGCIPVSADTITYFSAISNGFGISMTVAGIDRAGDFVSASFVPGEFSPIPMCSCSGGEEISILKEWNFGVRVTTQGGYTSISGYLPPITDPPGTHVTVTFPIAWSLDVVQFADVSDTTILWELAGFGGGTATADLIIEQDGGASPYYAGNLFTYQGANNGLTAIPEASSLWLAGVGLFMMSLIRQTRLVRTNLIHSVAWAAESGRASPARRESSPAPDKFRGRGSVGEKLH